MIVPVESEELTFAVLHAVVEVFDDRLVSILVSQILLRLVDASFQAVIVLAGLEELLFSILLAIVETLDDRSVFKVDLEGGKRAYGRPACVALMGVASPRESFAAAGPLTICPRGQHRCCLDQRRVEEVFSRQSKAR